MREGAVDVGQGLDLLADAPHPGPAADEAERDIGAEPGRSRHVVDARPTQDGGGVGRAATETSAGGDGLLDVYGCLPAGQPQGPADQVGVVGRHAGREPAGHRQRVTVGEGERVGEVERHHLGVEQVVAVGPDPRHPQAQGQLGGALA